jgi:PST family polysaccharide transporter
MAMLAGRSVLQNLVILAANVYLARLLSPQDYGIFGILQFALSLFKLIGDTGLGAALVQKKEEPSETELSSIWWFQLALGVSLTLLSMAVVPLVPLIWPSLPKGTQWLLPGLSLSLLFTMLQVVPFLMLERHVHFGWVGSLEFFGTIAYYGTAVLLATRGAGAAALVYASVGQAALVAVAANLVQPWRPKLTFSWSAIRNMMKFGFAFQSNNVVGFVNAAVTPLLAGSRLGSEAFGLIQFAQSAAFFPSLPVGIVRRVYFPFLSRLQHDRPVLVREFELSVSLCALSSFLFFAIFAGAAPEIVAIVYGQKWLPAVPALYVYSFGFCFNFYTWIGSAIVEALGQTKRVFWISLIGTLTNWAIVTALTFRFGTVLSFAWGYWAHLVAAAIVTYFIVRDLVPEAKPIQRALRLVPPSLVSAVLGHFGARWVHGPATLIAWVLAVACIFGAGALALDAPLRAATVGWLRRSRPQLA